MKRNCCRLTLALQGFILARSTIEAQNVRRQNYFFADDGSQLPISVFKIYKSHNDNKNDVFEFI